MRSAPPVGMSGAPCPTLGAVSARTAVGPSPISRGYASPRLPCEGLRPKRGPIDNVRSTPSPVSGDRARVHYNTMPRNASTIFGHPPGEGFWVWGSGFRGGIKPVFDGLAES